MFGTAPSDGTVADTYSVSVSLVDQFDNVATSQAMTSVTVQATVLASVQDETVQLTNGVGSTTFDFTVAGTVTLSFVDTFVSGFDVTDQQTFQVASGLFFNCVVNLID